MICSGCGKDIPFAGEVCPYCHRNKSNDQLYEGLGCLGGGVGVVIGVVIICVMSAGSEEWNFWPGAIIGSVIGSILAIYLQEGAESTNIQPRQPRTIIRPRVVPPPPRRAQTSNSATNKIFRIARDGEDIGEMSLDAIRKCLRERTLSIHDHFYDPVTNEWLTLDKLAGRA
ncbi:MAG: hypothetical protein RL088_1709 [Verrucomicrobiota bacterium]|jgi:hypothetical protein